MQAVERWFGSGFSTLHPLLQQLHRQGGTLRGAVTVTYGTGFAGWLGRRMAARFGIPPGAGSVAMDVVIHSDAQRLYWQRVFAGSARVDSEFLPVGHWPDGYWMERTGLLTLALTVDTADGGWRWRPLRYSLAGLRVPAVFMPRVSAYKRIEGGQYHFHVGVALPLLGLLFSYGGVLQI